MDNDVSAFCPSFWQVEASSEMIFLLWTCEISPSILYLQPLLTKARGIGTEFDRRLRHVSEAHV